MSAPTIIQMMQKMMKKMMILFLAAGCRRNCIEKPAEVPGHNPPKRPDEAGSATSAACVLWRLSSIEFWRAVGTPQVSSSEDACMPESST